MRTAAILAGGHARRFGGRPKALLPIGDQRLIDRQIDVLRSVAGRVAIVANDRDRYGAIGVPVWQDLVSGAGPLGAILTALVNTTTSPTLVVAGDMPFLTGPFLQHLVRVGRAVDVAIPRTAEGLQPLCASYGDACIPVIRRQIETGALKVTNMLSELTVREVGPDEIARFDTNGTLFFNINTPDDYTRCLELAR